MNYDSKNFAIAVIPLISPEQKETIKEYLCAHWNVRRIEFFFANQPDIFFAHGTGSEDAHRFLSRQGNSLGWQDEKRVALVSTHPEGVVTEGEQTHLLTQAVNNLGKKFPATEIEGVILAGNKPSLI